MFFRLLNRSVDSEAYVDTAERLTIFALILDRNPENIDAVFDFVAANYRKMHELYAGFRYGDVTPIHS